MKKHGSEIYPGQRNKEKRELFKRYRLRVIEDIYKKKFFSLFGGRCFKCGANERQNQEPGNPPVLCIDHHVPMVLGGHLVPGNMVSLCRACNGKKLDQPPENFYTVSELVTLQPLLQQQEELLSFAFNWEFWERDRKGYLFSLGVPNETLENLFCNPEHPDYMGDGSEKIGVVIRV